MWRRAVLGSGLGGLLCAVGALAAPPPGRVAAVVEEARRNSDLTPAGLGERLAPMDASVRGALRLGLVDPDPFVRRCCLGIMAAVGDVPTRQCLGLLKDPDEGVRKAAEDALTQAGGPAVAGLAELLLAEPAGSDAKVRAARALGRIGDPAGLPALLEVERRFRKGGFPEAVLHEAIARAGRPGLLELLKILHRRDVSDQSVYRALVRESASLRSLIESLLRDPARPTEERMIAALEGEIILGTAALREPLVAFYKESVLLEPESPPPPREDGVRVAFRARRFQRGPGFDRGADLPPAPPEGPPPPPPRRTHFVLPVGAPPRPFAAPPADPYAGLGKHERIREERIAEEKAREPEREREARESAARTHAEELRQQAMERRRAETASCRQALEDWRAVAASCRMRGEELKDCRLPPEPNCRMWP